MNQSRTSRAAGETLAADSKSAAESPLNITACNIHCRCFCSMLLDPGVSIDQNGIYCYAEGFGVAPGTDSGLSPGLQASPSIKQQTTVLGLSGVDMRNSPTLTDVTSAHDCRTYEGSMQSFQTCFPAPFNICQGLLREPLESVVAAGSASSSAPASRYQQATLQSCFRCYDHGCKGRKFSSIENYRRHVREKSMTRRYTCILCYKSFTRYSNLMIHTSQKKCTALRTAAYNEQGMLGGIV
jgi:hypothetical protein